MTTTPFDPLDPHAPVIPALPEPQERCLDQLECSWPEPHLANQPVRTLLGHGLVLVAVVGLLHALVGARLPVVGPTFIAVATAVTLFYYWRDFWLPVVFVAILAFQDPEFFWVLMPFQIIYRLGLDFGEVVLWHATATPLPLEQRNRLRREFQSRKQLLLVGGLFIPIWPGLWLFLAPHLGVSSGPRTDFGQGISVGSILTIFLGILQWWRLRAVVGRAWEFWLAVPPEPLRGRLQEPPGPSGSARHVLSLLAIAALAGAFLMPFQDAPNPGPSTPDIYVDGELGIESKAEFTSPDASRLPTRRGFDLAMTMLILLLLVGLFLPPTLALSAMVLVARVALEVSAVAIRDVAAMREHEQYAAIQEQIEVSIAPETPWQDKPLVLGINTRDRIPDVLPLGVIREGMGIFGPPGTGKTVFLRRLAITALRAGISPLGVDFKGGDGEWAETLREQSELLGIPMRRFSSDRRNGSHLMNIFLMHFWKELTAEQRVMFLLSICGAEHDLATYGAGYFTTGSYLLGTVSVEAAPDVLSLRQMAEEVGHVLAHKREDIPDQLLKAGAHLYGGLKRLGAMLALNAHSTEQVSQVVLDQRIDFADLFTSQCAMYISLPAATGSGLAGEIGRLVLRGLLASAALIPAKHRRQVLLISDEFQVLAGGGTSGGSSSINSLLAQSRSLDIGVALSCQSPGQIQDRSVLENILNNTVLRQWHGIGSSDLKLLETMSGSREATRESRTYSVSAQGPSVATTLARELLPALSISELRKISAQSKLFLWELSRDSGGIRTEGQMRITEKLFDCSEQEHCRRKAAAWPSVEEDPSMILEENSPPEEEEGRPPLPL